MHTFFKLFFHSFLKYLTGYLFFFWNNTFGLITPKEMHSNRFKLIFSLTFRVDQLPNQLEAERGVVFDFTCKYQTAGDVHEVVERFDHLLQVVVLVFFLDHEYQAVRP